MSKCRRQSFCDITGPMTRRKSICTDAINLSPVLDQDLHLAYQTPGPGHGMVGLIPTPEHLNTDIGRPLYCPKRQSTQLPM